MLTIGERMVNEPLNNTSLYLTFREYSFKCSVNKSYGKDQPIGFTFEFEDGSSLYYNRTDKTITRIKDFGQAHTFTAENANYLFENRLKRIMMSAKNKYIAKGKNANYDNYSR